MSLKKSWADLLEKVVIFFFYERKMSVQILVKDFVRGTLYFFRRGCIVNVDV